MSMDTDSIMAAFDRIMTDSIMVAIDRQSNKAIEACIRKCVETQNNVYGKQQWKVDKAPYEFMKKLSLEGLEEAMVELAYRRRLGQGENETTQNAACKKIEYEMQLQFAEKQICLVKRRRTSGNILYQACKCGSNPYDDEDNWCQNCIDYLADYYTVESYYDSNGHGILCEQKNSKNNCCKC